MLIIPTFAGEPSTTQFVRLDGVRYRIDLVWMERTSSWILSLYTPEGEALITGARLVTDWFPLRSHAALDPRLPSGSFFVFSQSGDNSDPTYDGLGVRVKLAYYTADEVDAIQQSREEPEQVLTITEVV